MVAATVAVHIARTRDLLCRSRFRMGLLPPSVVRPTALRQTSRHRRRPLRSRPTDAAGEPAMASGGLVCRRLRCGDPSSSPLRLLRNSFAARLEPSTRSAACDPCCEMIARSRSGSDRRLRQTTPTNRHSSRNRRLTESSQPSGISPTGFRSPRTNARPAHIHHRVSRTTTVCVRSSRRSSVSW